MILSEEWTVGTVQHLLLYHYDANGQPIGMSYRRSTDAEGTYQDFLFIKNIQGDITGIIDEEGNLLVKYAYDAWGNHVSTVYSNGGGATGARYNPFRYRGYYYDTETGLYYLNSRYYDPVIGRFISPDGQLNGGLLGYNLFAYCENNPVNYCDPNGNFPILAFVLSVTALIGLGFTVGGIISDNNAITAIGLGMVGVAAITSGGIALVSATATGATFTGVVGGVTVLAGSGSLTFMSAEIQEASGNGNWMIDAGMSELCYNTLMFSTVLLATAGTLVSSIANSFGIKSIPRISRYGKYGNEGYYGIKFNTAKGKTQVLTFHTHSHVPGKSVSQWHWQLQKWNPKAKEAAGTIARWIWWNLRRR